MGKIGGYLPSRFSPIGRGGWVKQTTERTNEGSRQALPVIVGEKFSKITIRTCRRRQAYFPFGKANRLLLNNVLLRARFEASELRLARFGIFKLAFILIDSKQLAH